MRPRTGVLLLAAVFAVLQLANVTGRDTPDTKNYLSYALSLGGADKREAAAATVEYVCAGRASVAHREQNVDVVRFHAPDPAPRVLRECRERELGQVEARLAAGQTGGHTVPFMPERFMRIFEARPGYPVFLAPFVALLGVTWGVWAASVVVACAGGVLAFLVLRALSVSVPLALTGQALFYVLPCGTTAMRPMAEGLLLALTLAALWGCALVLTGRRPRAGTALVAAALLALFAVKHSQALFLGLGLAGAGAAVAVRRRRRGPAAGARARGGSPGWGCAGRARARCCWPGCCTTRRRRRACRTCSPTTSPGPTGSVRGRSSSSSRGTSGRSGCGGSCGSRASRRRCGGRARGRVRRPAFGAFLVAAACTGFLNQAGHPDINIWGDRLIVLAWLLPGAGGAPAAGAGGPGAGGAAGAGGSGGAGALTGRSVRPRPMR
ncbi:hypothetical protein GCM10019016_111310 [Streptomyces prasinosporus]|uniref:Glycosyltransferase RgtA/B/C/D-like domain-containing protein n=1 Tax=Streptomyces prasinosporus TaxID=68256 RepID=A0ABP6U8G7_9ACTN